MTCTIYSFFVNFESLQVLGVIFKQLLIRNYQMNKCLPLMKVWKKNKSEKPKKRWNFFYNIALQCTWYIYSSSKLCFSFFISISIYFSLENNKPAAITFQWFTNCINNRYDQVKLCFSYWCEITIETAFCQSNFQKLDIQNM